MTGLPDYAAPLRAVDLLDVRACGDDLELVAQITVDGKEPNLRGHFPGQAVYPGIFVIETLEQAMREAANARLRTVRSVRFLAPVLDGDRMVLTATAKRTEDGWDVTGKAALGETTTAKIRATFEEEAE
ncbi:3R-hydroxymyristoyl ACP dehydrase [Amycolatopsis keratiniphila]|uniref:3R-hydroxymyristoyl ACP dehydrase n=1 Tax=Amycolatopsis keratiniphila TaxID=129921 RepID=R4TFT1_9PSEU|nr:3R-hydroxymyristoyl ACP dehydrase [Amycolatopsis keratiniphila]AGM09193.1 3R-hydroxymyristoyl ACP dehydrase [Amycolatopsis keratiniphila]